jgi:hypothetical protein
MRLPELPEFLLPNKGAAASINTSAATCPAKVPIARLVVDADGRLLAGTGDVAEQAVIRTRSTVNGFEACFKRAALGIKAVPSASGGAGAPIVSHSVV